MKRDRPETGEIYHVYNRGVEKRKIFLSDSDRFRFISGLYEFNDSNPVLHFERKFGKPNTGKLGEVGLHPVGASTRKFMVEILAFVLMSNHYHLMLRQVTDKGITEFMRKLGTGYTNYFNLKHTRVGSLFQNKYKIAHLQRQAHFLYLPHYIHLNPIDLAPKNSRKEALKFLDSYRWSSFPDYCGRKNFPSVISADFILDQHGGMEEYRKDLVGWLQESDTREIESVAIDSAEETTG